MRPDTSLLKYCRLKNSKEALKFVNDDPSYISYDGKTALILACMNELNDVSIELLKTEESIPNHIDDNNSTALNYACENEMSDVILEIMKYDSVDLDHIDGNGNTPLTLCCSSRNDELESIAIKLIDSGKCNLSHKEELSQTPLMLAIMSGFIELSIKLIESEQAEINYVDNQGNTALMIACESCMEEIALLILQKDDSDVNIIDDDNDSALSLACYNDLTEVCLKIITFCDIEIINTVDSFGKTPLIWFCKNKSLSVLKLLFELYKDIDISVQDEKGNIPLHYSIKCNTLNEISLLMIDLDPNLVLKPNIRGETPLNYICANNNTILIDKVIEKISYEEYIPVLLNNKMFKKVIELIKDKSNIPINRFILDLLNCQDLIDLLDILLDEDKIKNLHLKIDSVKKDASECIICFNSTYLCYLIQPCRHILTIDFNCISRLTSCPICRQEIEDKYQVYLS